jgi:hypothetical protein
MEFFAEFLISWQFVGFLIGLAAGGLAAWNKWDAVPSLVGGLAVFVAILLAVDALRGLTLEALLGAIMLGPVVGIVPIAAGYVIARWVARRLTRSPGPRGPGSTAGP